MLKTRPGILSSTLQLYWLVKYLNNDSVREMRIWENSWFPVWNLTEAPNNDKWETNYWDMLLNENYSQQF